MQIFWLELLKLVALVVGIVTFGRASPAWTCVAVGLAFGLHALASLWVVERSDGVPLRGSLAALWPALAACVPLVGAVLAARLALTGLARSAPVVELALEITAGALGYAAGAWLVARRSSEDLIVQLVGVLRPGQRAA